jgi:hypothetical protein
MMSLHFLFRDGIRCNTRTASKTMEGKEQKTTDLHSAAAVS